MNSNWLLLGMLLAAGGAVALTLRHPIGWSRNPPPVAERQGVPFDGQKIIKSDAEWRTILTPEQYRITRQRGTERACSGAYWNSTDDGIYECVCCGQPLFDSRSKFDSGTGWPSFTQAVDERRVSIRTDRSYGMVRSEVLCSRCDAHLGHVFADGPPPGGLRYCMNSAALRLMPRVSAQE